MPVVVGLVPGRAALPTGRRRRRPARRPQHRRAAADRPRHTGEDRSAPRGRRYYIVTRIVLVLFSSPQFFLDAGIGKLTGVDSKRLGDQEVLSRLTSSVSCALDEAAAALNRMRSENPINFQEAR